MKTNSPCNTSRRSWLSCSVAAIVVLTTTSCTFLPSSGPSGYRIRSGAKSQNYQLIPLDGPTLAAVQRHSGRSAYQAAGGRRSDNLFGPRGIEALTRPTSHAIALGDVLSIAIYETDGAIFSPSLASGALAVSPMTALPPQTVDRTGDISVPFVGRVKALGRLPSEVEDAIREGLRMKTADPQVIVTISERKGGDLISVTGDVKQPVQLPVALAGTRAIDAIAAAGGSQSEPHDTMVTITRGSQTRSDPLQSLYDQPSKNIILQPGDTVVLRKRSLNFMAFGATGRVGSYPITVEDLSLSDAVAASGGPSDLEANPATIFVYRHEPANLVQELGRTPLVGPDGTTAVIYQLDLTDPEGFFYANNFNVRDRDIIYYAPAGSTGVRKFMGLINTFLAPAIGGAGAASSATILSGT